MNLQKKGISNAQGNQNKNGNGNWNSNLNGGGGFVCNNRGDYQGLNIGRQNQNGNYRGFTGGSNFGFNSGYRRGGFAGNGRESCSEKCCLSNLFQAQSYSCYYKKISNK